LLAAIARSLEICFSVDFQKNEAQGISQPERLNKVDMKC